MGIIEDSKDKLRNKIGVNRNFLHIPRSTIDAGVSLLRRWRLCLTGLTMKPILQHPLNRILENENIYYEVNGD